ncbi:glutamine--fructose-6-phosphate transaminase (isomerizing) [Thiomicrospira sp.]|uniref:glutamine--fructose-6-phosphate transaminase (isomerizing) n=1 Tax=Thiomicrospira sp. TaxID=935 RepID=UPI002F959AA3
MCGIVGGIAERNVVPILLEGLKRLEYRGYDSSGIALINSEQQLSRVRAIGKIKNLEQKIENGEDFTGHIGIAHTRWATHGAPAENNAHPHICNNRVAIVHNGIIENYQQLKTEQLEQGYRFTSQTDTEVIAHAIYHTLENSVNQGDTSLLQALQTTIKTLQGAYALAIIDKQNPDTLVVARKGSPLVIGIGIGEHFIASDVSALLPVTQNFIFLEEGDTARITRLTVEIYNVDGQPVEREVKQSSLSAASVELGEHRHYMHKEIFEQPQAIIDTLEGRVTHEEVLANAFGYQAQEHFSTIKQVQIIACGTSYHAGLVAKYWFEDIIGLACQVEVASEYRYRNPVVQDNTLFVTLSQSGETADTLAALQQIKEKRACHFESLLRHSERSEESPATKSVILSEAEGSQSGEQDSSFATQNDSKPLNIPTLTICNVAESSLTRESDMVFLTHAGPEIGVASTKAFTTQLVALALLLCVIGKVQKRLDSSREALIVKGLHTLPGLVEKTLQSEGLIKELANHIATKTSAIFLGRGSMYPIAMEAALKLKEISYIHAEAYPAGELKHGPLALIDENIPVIAIAPHDELLEKLKSNLQEVNARGGQLYVFEDEKSNVNSEEGFQVIKATANVGRVTAPITFNIPLQLLAYYVALAKGTDVDRPRNLAKSVTVE